MSAIANVVVADATPTNHTLYPLSASIASSKYADQAANIMSGNRTLELKLSLASKTRATDRVTVLFASPKEQEVDGVWGVASIGRATLEYVIPEDWTSTERNHFATEVASLAANAVVKALTKRDPPY
jgi:anion-transporting  ArsA/GET3 family ATPase